MSGVHFLPPNVPDALGMKKASIFGKLRALWGREQSTDCTAERRVSELALAAPRPVLGTSAAEEAVLDPGWAPLPSPLTHEPETCVCPAGHGATLQDRARSSGLLSSYYEPGSGVTVVRY